jgi:hypothetical protein
MYSGKIAVPGGGGIVLIMKVDKTLYDICIVMCRYDTRLRLIGQFFHRVS